MTHQLPQLPYSINGLAPLMSQETLEYHYGKHLQTYVDNLNKLIAGTQYADAPLEDIIRTAEGGIFNNAAQTWNHTFFFTTFAPNPNDISDKLSALLAQNFGSIEDFKAKFTTAGIGLFGSGWVWLSQDKDGKLIITAESNAGNPLRQGLKPLLTLDVWEHAYYIDYRNARAKYISAFWQLVDWSTVESRLQ